ncbi:DeoR-family transcriptional regulator [Escherichia coli]|uniref:DeoR-family transcriptional regulator n=1 Tax=Escherichia coli TaxID=562 RepID=A0A2X1QC78_ECOLX|nr:DeoR-family transcriptional regulator [Escherichia coli]
MLTENIHFYKRASSFYEEKQLIARKALPFIDNKTTMAADSSSTVMELLKLLQDRSDLTLLTNSAEAIHVLAQSEIKVVSNGWGTKQKYTFTGKEELLKRSSAAIMSISW